MALVLALLKWIQDNHAIDSDRPAVNLWSAAGLGIKIREVIDAES